MLPLDKINNSQDLVRYYQSLDSIMQMRLAIKLGDKLAAMISDLDQLASLISVSHYKSISVIIDRMDSRFFNLIMTAADLEKILRAAPKGCRGLIINIMADRLRHIILSVGDLKKIRSMLDAEIV